MILLISSNNYIKIKINEIKIVYLKPIIKYNFNLIDFFMVFSNNKKIINIYSDNNILLIKNTNINI